MTWNWKPRPVEKQIQDLVERITCEIGQPFDFSLFSLAGDSQMADIRLGEGEKTLIIPGAELESEDVRVAFLAGFLAACRIVRIAGSFDKAVKIEPPEET